MRNKQTFLYILFGVALCWGGSSESNAAVPNHGSTASREKSSEIQTPEKYSFDADSWRGIFQDAQLRALIEQGLERNTDLNVARLRIDQAEASLKAAQLAFLPSLAFSPTAGISTFGNSSASKTYSLPLQASWQVDLFGNTA